MDQIEINLMMDKYAEMVRFSNTVGGRTNNLADWVSDVMDHQPSHGTVLAPGDALERYFGPRAHFVRLNEDTEGIGVLLLLYRKINDGMHPGGRFVFAWESVDLTDPRNAKLRKLLATMFHHLMPDNYDENLHIIKPITLTKEG